MVAPGKVQSKVSRSTPETMGQARTWDAIVSKYRLTGFCDRCAAQAAWGHQLGFTHVRPVGECCRGREVPPGRGDRARRWAIGAPIVPPEK